MRTAIFILATVVAACGTSQAGEPAATDGGDGGGGGVDARASTAACAAEFPVFTIDAGRRTCSAGCPVAVGGEVFDKDNQCRRQIELGCIACPNGCGGAPEGT